VVEQRFKAIEWVGEGGQRATLLLGDSGLELRLDGHLFGVAGPSGSQHLARAVLDRWSREPYVERSVMAPDSGLRFQYWCQSEVVWEAYVPFAYPVPTEGEQVDIGEVRYVVRSRVWSTSGTGPIGVGVCVHLKRCFDRSERPEHGKRCATLHGETCDCGAG